jgi:hypothetical protein
MHVVIYEGVKFFAADGTLVAEVRIAHEPVDASGKQDHHVADSVFRDDRLILLVAERLRAAGVVDVLGRHALWYDDGTT